MDPIEEASSENSSPVRSISPEEGDTEQPAEDDMGAETNLCDIEDANIGNQPPTSPTDDVDRTIVVTVTSPTENITVEDKDKDLTETQGKDVTEQEEEGQGVEKTSVKGQTEIVTVAEVHNVEGMEKMDDKEQDSEVQGEEVAGAHARRPSQYETMVGYLEEITGARDVPEDSIASTLSNHVMQHVERRMSAPPPEGVNAAEEAATPPTGGEEERRASQIPEIEITTETGSPDKDNKEPVVLLDTPNTRDAGEGDVEDEEHGLVVVSSGLLRLLCQVVVSLPSTDLHQVLGIILKPEALLVLAHHPALAVRTNAVKVRTQAILPGELRPKRRHKN